MEEPGPVVTEEEARRLWQRAAELQAEAAQRLEERSRQLVPTKAEGEPASSGYSLGDVRTAALGAGISPEFVDRALAEIGEPELGRSGRRGRLSRVIIGRVPAVLEVSRVLDRSAQEIYDAMKRIVPVPPYNLTLVDTHGEDPLDGATLVFEVPRFAYGSGMADHSFAYEMTWADVKQIHVTLTRLPSDHPSCEVTLRAPSKSGNGVAGMAVGTGVLLGGGAAGIAVAKAAAFGVVGVLGIGLGVAGLWGMRSLVRYGLRRSGGALERLLGAIAGDLQTGGAFSRTRAWPEIGPVGAQPSLPESGGSRSSEGQP